MIRGNLKDLIVIIKHIDRYVAAVESFIPRLNYR